MSIQLPANITYGQFTPGSVQDICDSLKDFLETCGWTTEEQPSYALITFGSGVPFDTQTITVYAVGETVQVFRYKNSPSLTNDIQIGADAADTASNTLAAINSISTGITATLDSSTVVRVTSDGTGFGADSSMHVESNASYVTMSHRDASSFISWGNGYKLTCVPTAQGNVASVWIDSAGATTLARIRVGTVDDSVLSAEETIGSSQTEGAWSLAVSDGRTLEFSGHAHGFKVFLLADTTTPGTKFEFEIPYIRPVNQAIAITAATNATPIVITAAGHGRITGDDVFITGVEGNLGANGFFTVTVSGDDLTLTDSVGTGDYTSGGLLAGPGQIARLFYAQGEWFNQLRATFRNNLWPADYGGGIRSSYFVLLNQFYYRSQAASGIGVSFEISANRASNAQAAPVFVYGNYPNLMEPKLTWPINSVVGSVFSVGQMWGAFLVMQPEVMDNPMADPMDGSALEDHAWMNYTHNGDGETRASLWIAKS